MMGAAVGGAVSHLVPGSATLFAVVGIAAFLGGAYKVPLAGVAFVAETTAAPAYIIPGLLAAAIAYLASGRGSLSPSASGPDEMWTSKRRWTPPSMRS